MKGFFSDAAKAGKPPISLVPQCGICRLYKTCKSPKMAVSGEGRRGILIVGEGPGKFEDLEGKPFVGESGRHLRLALNKFGIDPDRDCWITNSIICRAMDEKGSNRAPTSDEISYCRPNLTNTIKELQPKSILCLGSPAIESVLGGIWKDDQGYSMARWHGWNIPCQAINSWITATWHPSYLLRENNSTLQMFWEEDIESAIKKDRVPWKKGPPEWSKRVEVVLDDKEAAERIMLMTECGRDKPLSWDIETTTKKPDSGAAEIFSSSISDGKIAISYPWSGKAIKATISFLRSNVPKIGFNCKFEQRWCMAKLGVRAKNWLWDGMVNAHVLDCRPGICSLGFQSFVRLGIGKVTEGVSQYLKGEGSNTANRIRQAELRPLLHYGGLDALLEWKVAASQMKQVGIII